MSIVDFFHLLIALHITTGAPGLIGFWVPVATKKGGDRHRFWGRLFAISMLATGMTAIAMATTTIIAPSATHPHLAEHALFSDPALIQGIFGWMMLYLAILTINLAWYGWRAAINKRNHRANRDPVNIILQIILLIAAINCAVHGLILNQMMMIGISFVGFATVATNVWFLRKVNPSPVDWLLEHIKAVIGTGISVYTAFFAFGAVRLAPQLALTPALWALPLTTGLILIIWHQRKVTHRFSSHMTMRAAAE